MKNKRNLSRWQHRLTFGRRDRVPAISFRTRADNVRRRNGDAGKSISNYVCVCVAILVYYIQQIRLDAREQFFRV